MANEQTSVDFELPDGRLVSVITWQYVLNQFNQPLTNLNTALEDINVSLTAISEKLDEWIPN